MDSKRIDILVDELGMSRSYITKQLETNVVPLMQACSDIVVEEAYKIEEDNDHDTARVDRIEEVMKDLLSIFDDDYKANPEKYAAYAIAK